MILHHAHAVALSELSGFKRRRRGRKKRKKEKEEEARKQHMKFGGEVVGGRGEIAEVVDLMKMNHAHTKLPNNRKRIISI